MSIVLRSLLIFAILQPIRGCCINVEDEDTAGTSPSYPTITYTIRTTTTKRTTTTTKTLPSRRTTVKKTTTTTTTTTTMTTTTTTPFSLYDAKINCKKSEALHSFQVSILKLIGTDGTLK